MVALGDMHTRRRIEQVQRADDARRLSDVESDTLRATVARLTLQGRADGPMATACRTELARRGEQA